MTLFLPPPIQHSTTLAVADWTALDYSLLAALFPLLLASAFFSGSETALFGMSQSQRRDLRAASPLIGRTVDALLAEPRMLLITILVANMTVNTLYFVISSVLMMRSGAMALGQVALGLAFLLLMVLLGEVLPKMLATSARLTFARLAGPPLLAVHRVIAPVRVALNSLVVEPLSRLTAPRSAPHPLTEQELEALLEVSGVQGVIDEEEKRTLRDVFTIGRLKVRDVMTPRTRVAALPLGATRQDVIDMLREKRRTRLPVYRGDLDDIAGMLIVKKFLMDESPGASIKAHLEPPRYVPQIATLEQLLQHFQQTLTQSAIVVDEFGGTAGIVAIEDVVEEIVGDIAGIHEGPTSLPQIIGLNRWLADGEMPLHEWEEAFEPGEHIDLPQISTLGGLIIDRLGRGAEVGDRVQVNHLRLIVRKMDGERIATIEIVREDAPGDGERPTDAPAAPRRPGTGGSL